MWSRSSPSIPHLLLWERTRRRPGAPGLRRGTLLGECGAGLKQGLEITENPGPAAAPVLSLAHATHHCGGVRGAGEVMGHGQLRDPILSRSDFICQAREPLGSRRRIHQHTPRLDQLARRVGLDHFAVDNDIWRGEPHRITRRTYLRARRGAVRATRAEVELSGCTVPVLLIPLRLGDGVPDRLGRGPDIDAV